METIAKSIVLLALKGIDIQDKDATCLAVFLRGGSAVPTDKIDLISRATTFNAYNFLGEKQKADYMLLFGRYLGESNSKVINELLIPIS